MNVAIPEPGSDGATVAADDLGIRRNVYSFTNSNDFAVPHQNGRAGKWRGHRGCVDMGADDGEGDGYHYMLRPTAAAITRICFINSAYCAG